MIHPWLQPLWHKLNASSQRMAHALLFTGLPGLGKRDLVDALAARLLCEHPAASGFACGSCASCLLQAGHNHPDLIDIVPENWLPENTVAAEREAKPPPAARSGKNRSAQIVIEQIRQLQQRLVVTSHQGDRRAIIIEPVESMNTFTANALLKLLEEPPPDSSFLLISHNPAQLLPTLRSRCQHWRITPPSSEQLAAWKLTQPEVSVQLLSVNGEIPLIALRMQQQGIALYLDRFIHDVSNLGSQDALELAGKWEDWLKSSEASQNGFGLAQLSSWMLRWVSDLATLLLGGPARYFPHCHATLSALSQKTDVTSVLSCYNSLMQLRRIVGHPINQRLALEDMLIRYVRILTGT